MFEPFMKLKYTKKKFVDNQLKTIFHDYEIKEVRITENRAEVTVKYTFEIPEFSSPSGAKIRMPKREVEVAAEWIWIDEDWYRVFK
ncbi:MAG: hypothetical protein L0922_06720 [Candidatus Mariimomonas ferrooxydans]